MRASRYFLTLMIVYFLQPHNIVYAQKIDVEATELIAQKEYARAYKLLMQGDAYQASPYLQYLLGICYLHSDAAKSSALTHFEIAYDAKENRGISQIPGEVYYYLGISKHYNKEFNTAMNHFSEYRSFCEKYNGENCIEFYDDAGVLEKICQNAVDIYNNKKLKNTIIRPVNFPLNSSYNDYYPSLPSISDQLVYSSNRRSDLDVVNHGQDVIFLAGSLAPGSYHMFYGSQSSVSSSWNIDQDFLSFDRPYIAPVSFSSDGQTLLLLMGNNEEEAFLYLTNLRGNSWQEPKPLPANINLPNSNIKGATLAANGNRIYFSSNRDGGKGGYDIYVTNHRGNNQWTEPKNIGEPINTIGNEITPYISANMEEMYFSSDGHLGLGYYDIFVSKKSGTAWRQPENMGYPVNSTYNDICFTKSADGVKEMLSSDREIFMDGNAAREEAGEFANEANSQMVFSRGNYDIYEVTRFKKKMPLCIVSGHIDIKRDGKEVPFFMQVNESLENKLEPFVFEPDTLGSKYFMVLRGDMEYNMTLVYCYDSIQVGNGVKRAVYDTLNDFQLNVPKDTYNYTFNANIEVQVSKAFDQEISKYIKANSTDFVNTHVDDISFEKELEEVRVDALVLIVDRIIALGKKDVLEDIGKLESKVEYIQREESSGLPLDFEDLLNKVDSAFTKADVSLLVGLSEVMRHKDGLRIKRNHEEVLEEAKNIFNRRNKVTNKGQESLKAIADWVKEEEEGNVEFIYYGEPSDINAQKRTEEIKRIMKKFGLKTNDKMSGYIDSNYNQNQKDWMKFILTKKP